MDVSGEHSGDVIDTTNTDTYDTDPDSDTLTVTAIRTGSDEGSGTPGTVGGTTDGAYGTLTINSDGSYTYEVADNSTLDALDAGDIVTDTFNYTVSDGQGETDIAVITISIIGVNDAPTAVADTDTVVASATVTDTTNVGTGTLISDDTDADASSSLYITNITHSNTGNSSDVTYNSTKLSNAATIVGDKGTLTFGSDGSYSYTANLDVTSGPDVFTYTLTDGTSTTTTTLTIDVVVDHFGYIQEGKTLTVANTAALVSGTSTGSHTGDIIFNDTSDTYTVTQIQGAGSLTPVTDVTYSHGSATSVSGTYGTLTIGSDGSYQYVANSDISGVDAGGANVTDVFTFTEDTGSGNNTKTLTIYVIPSQDLTARDDTGTINDLSLIHI